MATEKAKVIKIFYCYAREDRALRSELEKHLDPLRRLGWITPWHDRMILAGSDWKQEIDDHLNTSQVILLLISSDFIASDYCYGIEMARAMKLHEKGEARVIPIILRPVDWKITPLAKLQALPTDGKPVSSWSDQDEAFLDVVQGIHKVIEQLTTKLHPPAKEAKSGSLPSATSSLKPWNPSNAEKLCNQDRAVIALYAVKMMQEHHLTLEEIAEQFPETPEGVTIVQMMQKGGIQNISAHFLKCCVAAGIVNSADLPQNTLWRALQSNPCYRLPEAWYHEAYTRNSIAHNLLTDYIGRIQPRYLTQENLTHFLSLDNEQARRVFLRSLLSLSRQVISDERMGRKEEIPDKPKIPLLQAQGQREGISFRRFP